VHFCIIGSLDAARLQLSTDTVPNCIRRLGDGSMLQKCTLTAPPTSPPPLPSRS
jgi:hypothetical protein